MKKRKRIHHFLGWVMLVVFTMGITPKIYLHDAFTHHKDQLFSSAGKQQKSIGAFEYSCGFINIEGTAPFLGPDCFTEPFVPLPVNECPVEKTADLLHRFLPHVTLRGPPSII